jgi:hypothetical protein
MSIGPSMATASASIPRITGHMGVGKDSASRIGRRSSIMVISVFLVFLEAQ